MIKLLSTDFDGTVIDHFAKPAVSPLFLDALVQLRASGVLWAVNTGRELQHIVEGLQELNSPAEPDFVLTAERQVFHRAPSGQWQDYGNWNQRCQQDHDLLFGSPSAGLLLADILEFLRTHVTAHPIYEGELLIGLVTDTDQDMEQVCAFLDRERGRVPGFQYMRNTIYARFCHEAYSKGTALGELGRLLEIGREEIFAAGDHYNDLPMLDGTHARWVTCPSNSVELVKATVLRAGGFVASEPCSFGLLEALHHFGAL
jgi:hydroxymethylpyrimidine pyrophosphatase-like HAD family hydrolase